jgi:hypothetical protein
VVHLQGAGLLWRLCGGKITDLHAEMKAGAARSAHASR